MYTLSIYNVYEIIHILRKRVNMPIINRISDFHEKMIEWRRDIHSHPELAYQEKRTAKKVVELLKEFGVDEIHEGIGGTGVVGVIKNGKGPKIGLRADMDALPITETNQCGHVSTNKGVMHACGHDGHTTMLLGAARYLSETRNFKGEVILIFQPAEEGFAGAKAMIEDGLFKKFPVKSIYGMHNVPGVKSGHLDVGPGPRMAAADNFEIKINGKGAHGAMPDQSIDPIVCGSAVVQALQSLVSRNSDPRKTLVVSVTQFNSGHANNVIPDFAQLAGTIRYFDKETGQFIRSKFPKIVNDICEAFGANAEINYKEGYPPTINENSSAKFALEVAKDVAGENASENQVPMMGSEDFSYFLQEKPGAYAWIGNGNSASLHNPSYDFNDDVLPIGASFLSRIAEKALNNN
jgi:hippurate hydrolase